MQLDLLDPSSEVEAAQKEETPNLDTAERVSTKIEQIGQRMRNVEEVFSASEREPRSDPRKSAGRHSAVHRRWARGARVRSRAAISSTSKATTFSACRRERSSTTRRCWEEPCARLSTPGSRWCRKKFTPKPDAGFRHRLISSTTITRAMGLGALVTLHDLESVEQIESELELSRRMAAIGRLTAGVGHEVKNPINAIVVHLELLKNKLGRRSLARYHATSK